MSGGSIKKAASPAPKKDESTTDSTDSTTPASPEEVIESAIEASDNYSKDVKRPKAEQHKGDPALVEQDFTFLTHTDPRRALPGGIYLDDVERANAEIARAKVEKRKPDLKNPPATQSTPVQPTHVVQAANPGDANVPVDFTSKVSVGQFEPLGPDEVESDRGEKTYL